MKPLIILGLLFGGLIAEEPSAFEMQSGATKQEIRGIKDSIESNSNKLFELESRIKNLDTSVEGLKSIYEGQSNSLNEINNKISSVDSKSDLGALQEQVSNNAKNIQTLGETLKNITSSIEQIQEILNNEINKQVKTEDPKEQDSKESPKESPSEVLANNEDSQSKDEEKDEASFEKDITRRGDIFKEARSLTYAKKFNEAVARYNWFIEIDYKKAESHYMLGNIAYEQNRYTDAIGFYKESAILDDKASYIPRLLLNSANSFRVLNDKENAIKFYNSLISSFPDSKEASEGKRQLSKLQ